MTLIEKIAEIVLEIRGYLLNTEFAPEPFTKPVDVNKLKVELPKRIIQAILSDPSIVEKGWVSVEDRLPAGHWNINHHRLSEEVLIANSCSINIGFYNRDNRTWYVDTPAKEEWIDKITHWMPLPINPHDWVKKKDGG